MEQREESGEKPQFDWRKAIAGSDAGRARPEHAKKLVKAAEEIKEV